jgi:hypothetical protein
MLILLQVLAALRGVNRLLALVVDAFARRRSIKAERLVDRLLPRDRRLAEPSCKNHQRPDL